MRAHRRTVSSIEWNLKILGGPAHGIVTKSVHKTLPGVVRVEGLGVVGWGGGSWGWEWRSRGGDSGDGEGMGVGLSCGVSRCHSIDLLPKFWLLHCYTFKMAHMCILFSTEKDSVGSHL